MRVFVHSTVHPLNRREIDTHALAFSVMQSRFYMELQAPHVIYADLSFTPTHLEFSPNGVHIFFAEESTATSFFSWLKKADQDAREYFSNMPD